MFHHSSNGVMLRRQMTLYEHRKQFYCSSFSWFGGTGVGDGVSPTPQPRNENVFRCWVTKQQIIKTVNGHIQPNISLPIVRNFVFSFTGTWRDGRRYAGWMDCDRVNRTLSQSIKRLWKCHKKWPKINQHPNTEETRSLLSLVIHYKYHR